MSRKLARCTSKVVSIHLPAILTLLNPHTVHLHGTEWGGDEAIERAVAHFERNAKRKVGTWVLIHRLVADSTL
jgi:hypothetical protein